MTQQTIFDQTERKKQEGIEVAYRNANTEWKRAAVARLHHVIQTQRNFTSDDILIDLEARGITTGSNKAIAGILQSFSRSGLITATDRFTRCRRPSRHGAPVMVWESNLPIKKEVAV